MSDDPRPPVDIRLHLKDGRVIPVDSRYVGLSDDQIHVWEVITEVPYDQVQRMTVGEFPGHTAIHFPLASDD